MRARWFAFLAIVLVASCACSGVPIGFAHHAPTPYYVQDTSPSALDLTLVVFMQGTEPFTPSPTTSIEVYFSVPGHLIAFHGGETLACNGAAPMTLGNKYVTLKYPTAAVAGKPFACVYTSRGHTAQIQALLPPAPQLLSPTQGATVLRQAALLVTYRDISGKAEIDAFSGANIPPEDTSVKITTPGSMTIDTTNFTAGPGRIEIDETPAVRVLSTGGFHSFIVQPNAFAEAQVTWV